MSKRDSYFYCTYIPLLKGVAHELCYYHFLFIFFRLFGNYAYFCKQELNISNSAKYWAELKDLSDNVKLELITLLSSSMTRTEKDIKKDASEKLEAALQKFNTDWGGDGSALEISHELREGIENSRTVEEW